MEAPRTDTRIDARTGIRIDTDLIRALVRDQFPRWAGLPVEPVPVQGHDNRTFRLGDELAVRLPSAAGYTDAVHKEHAVLPGLATAVPLPVPEPVAVGAPGCGYPFPWSVRRWLSGTPLTHAIGVDELTLARDLGEFLSALRAAPAHQGPAAGRHSFFRGCHPSVYGDEVGAALDALADRVDVAACRRVWLEATTSAWPAEPVWVHGDVAAGNLLVRDGRLAAVIDFGGCGVGDPACDLAMAWTHFSGRARSVFRDAAGLDRDTWRRARGWVLWKAVVSMAGISEPDVDGSRAQQLARALGSGVPPAREPSPST